MDQLADEVLQIIKDYRNDDGIQLDKKHIIRWANQFGDDAAFILKEINHILPKVYVSKSKAKEYISHHLGILYRYYKYSNITQFLMDTEFLDLQLPHKSQPAILKLLDEVLNETTGESYLKYVSYPKVNFIYFDDVLATGSTIGKELASWLNNSNKAGIRNIENILSDKYKLSINLFCIHSWGHSFQKHRLKKVFDDKTESKILWNQNFIIENHSKWNNQSLNVVFPVENQPANIKTYLASLEATKYEDYAYRKENQPALESFFSSAESRTKYENILLQKGISIIEKIKGEKKSNLRPLGLINPTYKTFGLGTHFFTWRNIPNNCPLVFWWQVSGHDWFPLFPVTNRGL